MSAKLVTEAIGTFFLVLTIGLTVIDGTPLAPLAIGSVLMVMVYMGGHISGAHYNPAVSLAIYMRGRMSGGELVPYWIAQLLGALLAALVVNGVTRATFAPAPGADFSNAAALVIEFLFTFALALVVLQTATARATEGNSYYGLAIGFTVMVGAFAGGPVSGGALNPAVGVGAALIDAIRARGSLAFVWIYLIGPFAGAAIAAIVFRMQNPDDV